ncbi:hypothetical protein CHF27_008625 [Romboutsia maritimum]|uniref:Uncharacterized protein n=1 Tax=Romboutsia maritimum TaxID=2020948 RepID=A0A371IS60_9FIRM|nr:hypothetical protein [Romboutsia maritimum]RDY23305.1 hypothetical protein CHF27_008625 [Romboutsia maritimum]
MNMVKIALLASGFLISREKSNKDKIKNNLPNFRGILEVQHYIPSRIRLNCPVLENNEAGEKALVDTCKKIPGINKIIVNKCIGTILVEYDVHSLEPVLIMGIILKVLGLENQIKKGTDSLIDRESINIAESLNRTVHEKTNGIIDLKGMIMILVGGYAMYDIKARPDIRPCGYTCLWWIYSRLADKI